MAMQIDPQIRSCNDKNFSLHCSGVNPNGTKKFTASTDDVLASLVMNLQIPLLVAQCLNNFFQSS